MGKEDAVEPAPWSQRTYQRLVESLPDVVFRLDRSRRFTFISPVAKRILGVSPATMLGSRIEDCELTPPLRDAIESSARQVSRGDDDVVGHAHCDDHGRHFRIRVVRERDHSRSLLGVVEDATAARDEAELLERMVSVVGHELRSPLSAILLTTQLLTELDPSSAVERIQRSAQRMERMIAEILDTSRVRHGGGLRIDPQPSDLAELIADQVDEQRRLHPDRELRVTTSGDGRGLWDPVRIAEVLSNLIGNAIRHGVGPIAISSVGHDDLVELRIRNRGAIRPDQLLTIFEPFRPGVPGRPGEGLGLGLFISRAIVDAHHGTIAAHGGPDTTEMVVRLPRRPGALPAPAPARRPPARSRRLV
jgi:PAS domain S-box-containing protein